MVHSVKEKKQKKALLGLIHVFLKDAGLKSTAKKLKSEHDEEVRNNHTYPVFCMPPIPWANLDSMGAVG